MSAMLQTALAPNTAHEAMCTGRRYGGTDALEAGIVSRALPLEDLLPAATEIASSLSAKAGPTLQTIRTTLYRQAIELMSGDTELVLPT
jgi:enoyl-CoA hydratase/carnithine racemase